jgi:hypothetical protein
MSSIRNLVVTGLGEHRQGLFVDLVAGFAIDLTGFRLTMSSAR